MRRGRRGRRTRGRAGRGARAGGRVSGRAGAGGGAGALTARWRSVIWAAGGSPRGRASDRARAVSCFYARPARRFASAERSGAGGDPACRVYIPLPPGPCQARPPVLPPASMPPQQPAPEEEGRLWRAVKMAAMVVGGQIVVKQLLAQFAPQPPPAAAVVGVQQHVPQASLTPDHAAAAAAAASDLASLPLDVNWPAGTALTLEIYTSTSPSAPVSPPRESPLVAFTNLTYGAWADQSRFADVYVDIPEAVISHNASLFADMFLRSTTTTTDEVTHVRHPLVKYMPPRKVRKEVSLLGNSSTVDSPEDDATPPGVIPHFSPNLTLALVVDSGTLKYRAQPAPIRSHIHLVAPGNRTYYPILYPNEFWHLQDSLIALNASSRSARLPLRVTCDPQAMWKFNLYAHMNMAFEQQAQAKAAGAATGPMGSAGGADLDELKKMLISANPYWLAITIVVTLLHTL